jgi:relaxase-like protein
MIPRITRRGSNFKGAFRYYLHDKGAETSHRVAWTQVENMLTQDPEKAWRVMAFTAQVQQRLKEASGKSRAGRKLIKPVFAFSLAWHPEQSPTPEHMLATAREAIAVMGLSEHEAVIVSHTDEPQKHVHVIVNRVHPITGMAGNVRNSKRKLSDFALQYERKDGKIYCQQREDNHREREAGKKTRYADPHLKAAWARATTGKGFLADLQAKGYVLAQGRKRLVVVDPHGKAHNPTRLVKGIKAKDLHALLGDVDLSALPDASAVQTKMQFREASRKPGATSPEPQTAPEVKPDPQAKEKARRDALREKHKKEQENFRHQHRIRMVFTRDRLVAFYALPKRKAELSRLRQQIRQAPWWKRWLGLTRGDRKKYDERLTQYRGDLEKCRAKFAAVKEKAREAWRTLKDQQDRELTALSSQTDARNRDVSGLVHQQEITRGRLSRAFDAAPDKTVARTPKRIPPEPARSTGLSRDM